MVNLLLEVVGFGCLVWFAWLVWQPASLLVLGVGLILAGNLRATREPPTARAVTNR